MKKICLIPGHSAKDSGAVSNDGKITEFNLNSKIVNDIKQKLKNNEGIILFREHYFFLPEDINETNCDIAIEFHCNASENKMAEGCEVLFYHTSKNGEQLAQKFQNKIIEILKNKDRKIKPIKDHDRGWYFLKNTKMPALILEPFFISNDTELKNFQNNYNIYIEKLANLIDTL